MKALRLFLLACLAGGSWLANDAEGAASSNTIVRFRLSHGTTHFGDIDVELFDDAKPITVSNFLYQVQTGSYDRSFLHRVVPGFVVQGGLYTVDNPYPSALFEAMTRIPEGPPITNEFNVGPRIRNTFGTLAMALSSTNIGGNDYPLPNTATASWFINTADNASQLDPNYCVFGRVKAGTSKLRFFNTLSEDKGIIVMQPDFQTGSGLSWLFSGCNDPVVAGEGAVQLDSLPVSYRFFDCPAYNTLFTVHIYVLNRSDVAVPKITITSPAVGGSVVNDPATVSGTVTDNMGVEQVRVYFGDSTPILAGLNTTNMTWSATLTNIPVGTNTLFVEATDASGNRSTVSRQFFRSVLMPIGLFLAGTSCVEVETWTNIVTYCGGTVQGATNGQLLEIGRGYKLTATPTSGNLFAGWYGLGHLISPLPTLSFIMESNLVLTAVFNTNLFPHAKGTYTGLFCDANQVEEWNSGFFTLTVGDLGSYTAKMWIEGKPYTFSGAFDTATGFDVNFLFPNPLTSSNNLFIRLQLDLHGGRDYLSGSFSNYYRYLAFVTNGPNPGIQSLTNRWVSELHAYRPTFTSANSSPQAGKYTLIIPVDTNSTNGPSGDGYGIATVSTKGSLTFSGSLSDGTKVTQKIPISKYGDWPLYVNLYKGKGTLLSRMVFDTNQPDTDVSGLMNWFKRTQVAKYFGVGFTNESMIVGSRFVAPTGTNRLLELTAGVVGFTNGNLVADFANDVTVDAAGKVTNQDANKLSLSLSKSSGSMSGSVTPPGGVKAVPFKGVVLQKQNRGSGYFLGTNASGRVSLGP